MSKPCEYCGADLPHGVDKATRRIRSFHFNECTMRPAPVEDKLSDIVERLRNYNPPDRTVDEQRQISVDIHEAADEIERLRAALGDKNG